MARRARQSAPSRQLGKLPPRYRFVLNPYSDIRLSVCPQCRGKTRQRKLPLVIHLNTQQIMSLNKTCRLCPSCDLLMAHRDEIEPILQAFLGLADIAEVRERYFIFGTMDRADWLRGLRDPRTLEDMLDHVHDFRDELELKVTPGGWSRAAPE